MAVHELTLKSIMDHLDGGRVAQAFQAELRRAILDCDDRPGDDKERKVTLELKLTPIDASGRGDLDSVKGKFHVTSTVPKRRSKDYSFGFRKKAGQPMLVFNDLSDDDIHQQTLDE